MDHTEYFADLTGAVAGTPFNESRNEAPGAKEPG
jgi:hypothetical protein